MAVGVVEEGCAQSFDKRRVSGRVLAHAAWIPVFTGMTEGEWVSAFAGTRGVFPLMGGIGGQAKALWPVMWRPRAREWMS